MGCKERREFESRRPTNTWRWPPNSPWSHLSCRPRVSVAATRLSKPSQLVFERAYRFRCVHRSATWGSDTVTQQFDLDSGSWRAIPDPQYSDHPPERCL